MADIIQKAVYTEKQALKLLHSLDEKDFTWRSGHSLISHTSTSFLLECLPCDIFIDTEYKYVYYDSDRINHKEKIYPIE